MTILQLVGFNFKQAIGQPLTQLVERLILSQVPAADQFTLAELQTKLELAYADIIRDPDASERLTRFREG